MQVTTFRSFADKAMQMVQIEEVKREQLLKKYAPFIRSGKKAVEWVGVTLLAFLLPFVVLFGASLGYSLGVSVSFF